MRLQVLAALGAGTLGNWLDENWQSVVEEKLEITRDEFQQLVDKHILGLITISSLVALVLALDLLMVCVLQARCRCGRTQMRRQRQRQRYCTHGHMHGGGCMHRQTCLYRVGR